MMRLRSNWKNCIFATIIKKNEVAKPLKKVNFVTRLLPARIAQPRF